jgi:hypothetical protein
MQWRYRTLVSLLSFLLAGCSNSGKAELNDLKDELTQAKGELAQVKSEQTQLKNELAKLRASASQNSGVITLEGEETIDATGTNLITREKLIYYKRPFDSPPYLTITQGRDSAGIQDQKADSFKLLIYPNGIDGLHTVKWKAEGLPKK